mgnify:CR=1 FL=1
MKAFKTKKNTLSSCDEAAITNIKPTGDLVRWKAHIQARAHLLHYLASMVIGSTRMKSTKMDFHEKAFWHFGTFAFTMLSKTMPKSIDRGIILVC